MTEVEIKLRYNSDAETVELVVGDEVVGDSGSETFASWADAYAEAHPDKWVAPVPEPTEEDRLRQQVEDLTAQLEVANAANAPDEPPASNDPVARVDSNEQP